MAEREHKDESNPKGELEVKGQRKRTAAEKRERLQKYMTVFINGKQKRVRRPQLIEGLPVDEFIAKNADPIWLQQNEMWELMTPEDNHKI